MQRKLKFSFKKVNEIQDNLYKVCASEYQDLSTHAFDIGFKNWDRFVKMCEALGADAFDEVKILLKARVGISPMLEDPWEFPKSEISSPSPH